MLHAIPIVLAATLEEACGPDPEFFCETIFDATDSETLAEVADFLVSPISAASVLFGAYLVNRVVRRFIDRGIDRLVETKETQATAVIDETVEGEAGGRRFEALQRLSRRRAEKAADRAMRGQQRTQTLGTVLRSIAALVIYSIGLMMALGQFNINLGPFIASAGIVGVAVGFGAQSLVKDFLSGIFMLIEDQYGVGDVIDVGDAAGVVEEVKLRTTKIRDVNGTLWHVPNGEIRRVANKSQDWARTVLDIEVAYDTDIDHAMSVIKEVADSVWEDALENATILEEPQVVGVQSFGADAVALRLVAKVEPAEQFATAREIRRRLKDAFDREEIEIPFPQRTVWMHQVAETVKTPKKRTSFTHTALGGVGEVDD